MTHLRFGCIALPTIQSFDLERGTALLHDHAKIDLPIWPDVRNEL